MVKTSSSCKYMGLYFTPTLSWPSAQEKLALQAKKAILSIYNFQRSFGYFSHKDLFKLFDSILKPILCYGAQMRGHIYSNVLESVHFVKGHYLPLDGMINIPIYLVWGCWVQLNSKFFCRSHNI